MHHHGSILLPYKVVRHLQVDCMWTKQGIRGTDNHKRNIMMPAPTNSELTYFIGQK